MKKYYMSMIDFSEIRFFTNDLKESENCKEMLLSEGIVNEKDSPNKEEIQKIADDETVLVYKRLCTRLAARANREKPVIETFRKLHAKKDYGGMYLYLAFLYGFISWRMPLNINLISARDDTLKIFFEEFMKVLTEESEEKDDEKE